MRITKAKQRTAVTGLGWRYFRTRPDSSHTGRGLRPADRSFAQKQVLAKTMVKILVTNAPHLATAP